MRTVGGQAVCKLQWADAPLPSWVARAGCLSSFGKKTLSTLEKAAPPQAKARPAWNGQAVPAASGGKRWGHCLSLTFRCVFRRLSSPFHCLSTADRWAASGRPTGTVWYSAVRHCLCLSCFHCLRGQDTAFACRVSTAFAAKTLPLPLRHCLRGQDTAFASKTLPLPRGPSSGFGGG